MRVQIALALVLAAATLAGCQTYRDNPMSCGCMPPVEEPEDGEKPANG